ncbi:hypothetical protein WDW37_11955 [Bdellovibrionota bacterium FG-1]
MKNPVLNSSGQGLTEYITLLLLISIVSMVAAQSLGGAIKRKIEVATRHINSDLSADSHENGG